MRTMKIIVFLWTRKWYRAVVTNCCPTSVLFVDYGNSEQVEEVTL